MCGRYRSWRLRAWLLRAPERSLRSRLERAAYLRFSAGRVEGSSRPEAKTKSAKAGIISAPVSLTDAEQAVVDHLVAEPGPVLRAGPPTSSGWRSVIRGAGGEGADPDTVRFRRCREFRECQMHAVSYFTRDGEPRELVARTVRQPGGAWSVAPVGGGGGGQPARGRPWVNFTAQWGGGMFAAGGDVIGTGAERARLVRLAFADDTTVNDVPHDGVVLFYLAREITFPAQVEILDQAGGLLACYEEFADLT